MNKSIATIALAAAVAASSAQAQVPTLEDLSISGSFVYESEYIFRGANLNGDSFQPQIEFGLPLYGGNLYAGIWTNLPISETISTGDPGNEVDPYIGYAYPVTDIVTVDVGFTYFWFPEDSTSNTIDRTREIYVGVQADVADQIFVTPAVYFYYDFDLEQVVVEGSVGYTLDLEDIAGIPGVAVDTAGYVGFVSTDDTSGGQGPAGGENGYTYYGGSADLIYSLNENIAFSVGVRVAANNDDDTGPANGLNGGDQASFWWGGSASFSY
ncbi:MAG: TorF family putative porin [Opitutales bacterium]